MIKDPAPANIIWKEGNCPWAVDYDDIYYNGPEGLAESRHVFIDAVDGFFCGQGKLVLAEIGFGTGLNFIASWQRFEQSPLSALHYVAIEAHPMARLDLLRALDAFPEISRQKKALAENLPPLRYGVHRLFFDKANVILTLLYGPAPETINWLEEQADGWFLDGFAPAKNPQIWTQDLLAKIETLTVPGGVIASFSVAGSVRKTLESCGLAVEKKPGFGRKKHALKAVKKGLYQSRKYIKPERATIIGAGIAGSLTSRALERYGVKTTLMAEAQLTITSRQKAVMVQPRPYGQENPGADFFHHSWMKARFFYDSWPDALLPWRGIHCSATDIKTKKRFEKLAQASLLEKINAHYDAPDIFFPEGFALIPTILFDHLHKEETICSKKVTSDTLLQEREKTDIIIIAAGVGSGELCAELYQEGHLPLRRRYGGASIIRVEELGLKYGLAGGIWAIPLGENLYAIGATHRDARPASPEHDHRENIAKFADFWRKKFDVLPENITVVDASGGYRAGFGDRLPAIGKIGGKTYLLTGLGGQGFLTAPLLAEILAGQVMNCPFPAEYVARKLSPFRFVKKP